jgi:hypothetical protein
VTARERRPPDRADVSTLTEQSDESNESDGTTPEGHDYLEQAIAEMAWRVARRYSDTIRTPRGWDREYEKAGVR